MNVQKISYNTNNQPQFRARLPKEDLHKVVKEVINSDNTREYIPRLYTSLEYLDSILPGKKLKLKKDVYSQAWPVGRSETYTSAFVEDDKNINSSGYDFLTAIENLFLAGPEKQEASKQYLRMPKSVYENLWWQNRNVKAEDIDKFAFEAKA